MRVIVYDKNTQKKDFTNYGLGKLRKIRSCKVIEELNGRYEVELEVDRDDSKAGYLKKWAIVSVDGQLFRIVSVVQSDINNTIKVVAQHIFYDLDFGFIEDRKAEDKTLDEALEIGLPQDMWGVFTHSSDITSKKNIYFVKNNGVNAIFRIIERWGMGELVRDNFHYAVNLSKGADKGVTFTYKKIDEIEVTEVTDDVVTRIYPVGNDGITLDEKYITIPNWSTEEYLPYHITKEVKYEADNQGDLRVLATEHAKSIGISRVNFKMTVNDLLHTELYKDVPQLMAVDVGDIVTIKHSKLNIREKIKVIKKEHELVSDTVTIELGQALDSFFKSVDNSNVSLDTSSLNTLKDGLFYHSNGTFISINNELKEVASIVYAVNQISNLVMYINIFYECVIDGSCTVVVYHDNEVLEFQPTIDIYKGKSVLAFTYPLMSISEGVQHLVSLRLKIDGRMNIPVQNLQVMIKGQGLAGGGAERPHAEIIDTFELSKFDINKLSTKPIDVKVTLQKPKRVILDDKLSTKPLDTFNLDVKCDTINIDFDIYEE